MTAAQLLRTCRVQPFMPFVIHLVDGGSLMVKHPQLVILAGGGRIAVVEQIESFPEVVDVLMIVSLRPVPPASGA